MTPDVAEPDDGQGPTAPLPTRALGSQGLEVPALGLGCVGMSEMYGPREPAESIATIERALDAGGGFFDTSDVYGVGHNERFLGAALARRRDDAVVATKFGAIRKPDGTGYTVDGGPDHVAAACDASLDRLGTEWIDLYYQHRMDPATPIEDTVGAMALLVEAGKVRFLGLSECPVDTLRRAHAVHPISAVQIEYSLFAREPEADLLPVCRELGVGLVAYSPLGRGILTGAVTDLAELGADDYRHADPRFQGDNFGHNMALVRAVAEIAARKACAPSTLALAWLLAAGDDIVPIPGTTRRRHFDENVRAVEVALSDDDFDELSTLVGIGAVAGDRYPPDELARLLVPSPEPPPTGRSGDRAR